MSTTERARAVLEEQLRALELAAPEQEAELAAIEREILELDAQRGAIVAQHIRAQDRGTLRRFGALTLDHADQQALGLTDLDYQRGRLLGRKSAQERLIRLRKDIVRQVEAELAKLESAPA